MTNQEKIQYLKEYRSLVCQIERKNKELNFWKMQGEIAPPIPHSNAYTIIKELETRLQQELYQLSCQRDCIQKTFDQLKDKQLQLLLEYRYIDGYTLEEIAQRMHYSFRHTCRLHEAALDKLAVFTQQTA